METAALEHVRLKKIGSVIQMNLLFVLQLIMMDQSQEMKIVTMETTLTMTDAMKME